MKQRDGETSVYNGLVTGLSLEHARVLAEASAARQAERRHLVRHLGLRA